jgi:hypothetical protein
MQVSTKIYETVSEFLECLSSAQECPHPVSFSQREREWCNGYKRLPLPLGEGWGEGNETYKTSVRGTIRETAGIIAGDSNRG